jgi:hypothetical protein
MKTISLMLVFVSVSCLAQYTASGPIMIDGQNGTVVQGLHITSTEGNCITVRNSTNISIKNNQIGPCGIASGKTLGNGISLSGNTTVYIFDNYIHEATLSSSCCDYHDSIFGTNFNNGVTIQGNVIVYGESNVEFTQGNSNITVIGNFMLNPRGPKPRGQNFQCYGGDATHQCRNVTLTSNYTLSSTDPKYTYPENQEDSVSFGFADTALVNLNYITGGHSFSGCGLIADEAANSMSFESNMLLNTGQCGIGVADGTNQLIYNNKVYNTNPVRGGGNTAIYTWKQPSEPCGPTRVTGNIADEIRNDGTHSGWWDGGGCSDTLSGNTFNEAADPLLTPVGVVFPTPLIPPQPKNCITQSPYTTNTPTQAGVPYCSN